MTQIRDKTAKYRAGRSARAARTRIQARSDILEHAEERRASVYRTDVEFAPQKGSNAVAYSATRRLDEIRKLYTEGMSQLDVATALEIGLGTVGRLIKKHGIEKGNTRE